jgi:methyltransferase
MVALHTTTIAGSLLFGRSRVRYAWLVLLLAVQPIRVWILVTLGRRWNTRGVVDSSMAIATDGPYRFVRHPNYSVVAVELLALPLAFGMRQLALAATLVNAMLMVIRIREEERLLGEIPGYDDHFAQKPRFLPRLR